MERAWRQLTEGDEWQWLCAAGVDLGEMHAYFVAGWSAEQGGRDCFGMYTAERVEHRMTSVRWLVTAEWEIARFGDGM
jgi:hypothetical protein